MHIFSSEYNETRVDAFKVLICSISSLEIQRGGILKFYIYLFRSLKNRDKL